MSKAYWCVIPAAGAGRRFGAAMPKQYLRLGEKPLLLHTLERLAAHPQVAGLMVVIAADDSYWTHGMLEVLGKPLLLATGGSERADSVLAGLRALPSSIADDEFVLVHDAARPCVSAEDISRLVARATAGDGGLLAAPLRDTLKRADADGCVQSTEPREARWRALTPQMFRRGPLSAALAAAAEAGVMATDESMAMERAGHRPLLVEGAETNLKVTTPADLLLAEFLLARHVG
ncbi:2-C-methyl-D-erythritol 4-phosphate cytidylyltransferase [Tahibacter amnicola]|uniref:2-C-methyl-D-erythritol 4-phosphate cytidylyltransferase n=1 Tax=Tahibacter amnicola TaxID=2976241 RepID=A0ABY6BI65_9GAMM|nr:2-C-methyl-D-erythritol 4-phosphate cytidylyltransferase [Tahibacter amnicola]UXI69708.1 2-C-methyl-D-erythritol 4-phosphate cytidylyltransferase [Tahibacter amnicola]